MLHETTRFLSRPTFSLSPRVPTAASATDISSPAATDGTATATVGGPDVNRDELDPDRELIWSADRADAELRKLHERLASEHDPIAALIELLDRYPSRRQLLDSLAAG